MEQFWKNPKIRMALFIALCLTILLSALMGASIAQYLSHIIGRSDTSIAVWSIEVNDQQVASSETQTFTFDLYDTLYEEDLVTPENHVSPGVIAPGTGGSFTLKVENLSQVDAEFTLVLTEGNEDNIPIQYSTDRTTWYDDLSSLRYLFTDFFLERETGIASKTIYWRWCYMGSNTSHLGQTDNADTALGFLTLTKDVNLTITADLTVGQYIPRPEAPAQGLLAAAEVRETSITLQAIDGAEYSMDGITWQDSPAFTGLTAGTEYTFYVRYKETDNDLASKSSSIRLNTTITYTDFVVTVENRHKIGFTNQTTDLVIPETFYDEEDNKWYRTVGFETLWNDDEYNYNLGAFAHCNNLENVTIPNSITDIPDYTFTECTNLKKIVIPNGVESIGYCAFMNCTSLNQVAIPDSITGIWDGAFANCNSLTEITFGTGLDWCGEFNNTVFYVENATPLYVTGGNSVVYSYDWASDNRTVEFAGVEYTDFIITQENREKIGYNSYSTSDLNIPATFYDEEDGVWYRVTAIDSYAFYEGSLSGSLTIPEGVTSIGAGAFESCGITSVYIPNSVKSIGESAFFNCCRLTEITFGSGITSISSGAFYDGEGVYTTIIGGNSVVYSYDWAGDNRSVEFTDIDYVNFTVTSDNAYLVGYTSVSIENLIIPSTFYDGAEDTWYKVVGIGESAFFERDLLKSVTLPDTITSIGSGAFEYCYALESINIPEGVTSIGNYAFDECPLSNVTLPTTLTHIGESAFSYTNIASFVVPDGITTIPDNAFMTTALTEIYLPDTITSIGRYAFGYDETPVNIYFAGTEAQWNTIEFDDYWQNPNYDEHIIHYNYTAG